MRVSFSYKDEHLHGRHASAHHLLYDQLAGCEGGGEVGVAGVRRSDGGRSGAEEGHDIIGESSDGAVVDEVSGIGIQSRRD